MYLNDTTRGMQLGKSGTVAKSTASGAAAGASIGSVVPVIGTAIGAAIGAVAGAIGSLAAGIKHFSPWNFLYDEYPNRIYNNEVQIANARNAIAQIQGGAVTPKPPGPPGTKGGPAYQESMQAIVPRYVPGSEAQIAAYNRVLNEKGGAYERTYAMQLQLMQELAGQAQSVQTAAAMRGNIPVSGSATSPMLSSQPMQPVPMSPATVQVPSPSFGMPLSPSSYGIAPTDAPATAKIPLVQSGLSGSLPLLLVVGAAGLAMMFMTHPRK